MEKREREFLKTAYILYNNNILSNDNLRFYLFSFANGDGKANLNTWMYNIIGNEEIGVKDGVSAVRYYQDWINASVDNAINNLLQIIKNNDNNPLVNKIKNNLYGGDRWLKEEDIPTSIFKNQNSYKLTLGKLKDSGKTLSYSGEGSLITIAPPGAGKTQCLVLPNMLTWQGAAVVLDVKGEIYDATHQWRQQNVGPVYKFSPLDPANSHSYNPLSLIRDDEDYIWEDATFLAEVMIVPNKEGNADPFWQNKAQSVLTAAIAHVCFNNEPADRAMSKVIDLMYGIGWDEMVTFLKTNVFVDAMRQTGHSLSNMSETQRDSVLQTAQNSLKAWQGRIAKVTQNTDWNPANIREGNPTIYICINPSEIDTYLSVLRVFIAQHIQMLFQKIPKKEEAPVLFMLDEMPRLRNMPPILSALDTGRQYGLKLWMFAQSFGQIKDAYSNPDGIISSCAVKSYMNLSINDELTQKISDQLGSKQGPLDASRVKVAEPIDLAGPKYEDTILVFGTNSKPAQVKKQYAYKDPEMQAKMNL